MTRENAYGGLTFDAAAVRVCAFRDGTILDATFLAVGDAPSLLFELMLSNGTGRAAVTLERVPIRCQSKLEPSIAYTRDSTREDQFSIVGPTIEGDLFEGLGNVANRQRELDVIAKGYGTNRDNDPWFDANRVAAVVAVQVRLTGEGGCTDRALIVPLTYDESSDKTVRAAVRAQQSAGLVVDQWSMVKNVLSVPGNGTVLSWTTRKGFSSADEYVGAFRANTHRPI